MVYRRGERTNKHREADYPFAVDIPILGDGLEANLDLIGKQTRACAAGAEEWSHRTRTPDGRRLDWHRIGTKDADDADRIATLFVHLGARRVR